MRSISCTLPYPNQPTSPLGFTNVKKLVQTVDFIDAFASFTYQLRQCKEFSSFHRDRPSIMAPTGPCPIQPADHLAMPLAPPSLVLPFRGWTHFADAATSKVELGGAYGLGPE